MARGKANGEPKKRGRKAAPEQEVNASSKPTGDQVERFKSLMDDARERRAEANSSAGEAREIFKDLGFDADSIAMFKKLVDMGPERGEGVFAELCQLLTADPSFDLGGAQADMFASAAVKADRAAEDEIVRSAQRGEGGLLQ